LFLQVLPLKEQQGLPRTSFSSSSSSRGNDYEGFFQSKALSKDSSKELYVESKASQNLLSYCQSTCLFH